MRWRGVHHVEFSVLDYERSVAFYDRMFGWLGYQSFWTLDIGYRSTYYLTSFVAPHSYIGVQPARTGGKLRHEDRPVGVHHIALWAKSRREIDGFHRDFLRKNGIAATEAPAAYPHYAPGYYAVFFDDPINGIHWELAHTPRFPAPWTYLRWTRAFREKAGGKTLAEAMRRLPGR